eukprot:COSAG01_NODE_906_length_12834_cov_53.626620_7_plen_118_part_00
MQDQINAASMTRLREFIETHHIALQEPPQAPLLLAEMEKRLAADGKSAGFLQAAATLCQFCCGSFGRCALLLMHCPAPGCCRGADSRLCALRRPQRWRCARHSLQVRERSNCHVCDA